MNEIGSQLGVLYEQIKASEFQIDSAKQTIAESQSGIEAAQGEVTRITALVRELQQQCDIPASRVFMHSQLVTVASPGGKFPHEMFALQLSN